jgi:hypothetical protein
MVDEERTGGERVGEPSVRGDTIQTVGGIEGSCISLVGAWA